MNPDRSDFQLAAEPLLGLVASAIAGAAGYVLAVSIFRDGDRAVAGFFWGTTVFALAVWVLTVAFGKTYRERGGSPGLIAAVVALIPAIMLVARAV